MSFVTNNHERSSLLGGMWRAGCDLLRSQLMPTGQETRKSRIADIATYALGDGIVLSALVSAVYASVAAAATGAASLVGRATPGIAATAVAAAGAAMVTDVELSLCRAVRDVRNPESFEDARKTVPSALGSVALGALAVATIPGALNSGIIAYVVRCGMNEARACGAPVKGVHVAAIGLVAAAALQVLPQVRSAAEVGGVIVGVMLGFLNSHVDKTAPPQPHG